MPQGEWQRPEGVTKGTWDYIRSHSIAAGYDQFLHNDRLTLLDAEVVSQHLPPIENNSPSKRVVEFGCGTGRTLIPLAERGYEVVGIDLSLPMLQQFVQKANSNQKANPNRKASPIIAIAANLTELDGLSDNAFDHGVCLFSTLGMIQGRLPRSVFLRHAARTIRPGGILIVHAHRALFQVRQVGGLNWFLRSAVNATFKRQEFGDRYADYRGINNFFIHSFRWRELQRDLTAAGFEHIEALPILHHKNGLKLADDGTSVFTKAWSTVGWIIVCKNGTQPGTA